MMFLSYSFKRQLNAPIERLLRSYAAARRDQATVLYYQLCRPGHRPGVFKYYRGKS